MNARLRLGYYYHAPGLLLDGRIRMQGLQARFVDCLAQRCENLVCFLHRPEEHESQLMDAELRSANVQLVPLETQGSLPQLLFKGGRTAKIVQLRCSELDAILIRGPNALLPRIVKAVRPCPAVLLLVGDLVAGTKSLSMPWWRKRTIGLWRRSNRWAQERAARDCLTFVNSRVIYDRLQKLIPDIVETRTSTVSKRDFFIREDTCLRRPVRILYAGRIEKAKGVCVALDALNLMVKSGTDAEMWLAGWAQKGDSVCTELEDSAHAMGLSDRLKFLGYKGLGEQLFSVYRQADIFIMPSLFEGFPRSIWEAMSQCTPVVATKVGSIPIYLKHLESAVLVEPNDPAALASGVTLVIENRDIRRELIGRGFILASENTLERRADEMIHRIEEWLANGHRRQ